MGFGGTTLAAHLAKGGRHTGLIFWSFFPIAVYIWVEDFKDRRLCFWAVNQAVVPILVTQSSRSPRVSALLQPFVLHGLHFNIGFGSLWAGGY